MGPFQYQERADVISTEAGSVIEPEKWAPWMQQYPGFFEMPELIQVGVRDWTLEDTGIATTFAIFGWRNTPDQWQPDQPQLHPGQGEGAQVSPPLTVLPPTPLITPERNRIVLDRVPIEDRRLRRVVDYLRLMFNSLVNRGQLVQVSDTEFVLAGGSFAAPRPPGATDDITAGCLEGTIWVDTATDTGYVCVDSTANAAIWDQISN